MTLNKLCESICLPEQMKRKVLDFEGRFDEQIAETFSTALYDPSAWEKEIKELGLYRTNKK